MNTKINKSQLLENSIQGNLLVVFPNGKCSVAKVKLKPKRAAKLHKQFVAKYVFAKQADMTLIQDFYAGVFYVTEFEMPPYAIDKILPSIAEEYFATIGSGSYVFHVDGATNYAYLIDDAQFDHVLKVIGCPDEMTKTLGEFSTLPYSVKVVHLERNKDLTHIKPANDDSYEGVAA